MIFMFSYIRGPISPVSMAEEGAKNRGSRRGARGRSSVSAAASRRHKSRQRESSEPSVLHCARNFFFPILYGRTAYTRYSSSQTGTHFASAPILQLPARNAKSLIATHRCKRIRPYRHGKLRQVSRVSQTFVSRTLNRRAPAAAQITSRKSRLPPGAMRPRARPCSAQTARI